MAPCGVARYDCVNEGALTIVSKLHVMKGWHVCCNVEDVTYRVTRDEGSLRYGESLKTPSGRYALHLTGCWCPRLLDKLTDDSDASPIGNDMTNMRLTRHVLLSFSVAILVFFQLRNTGRPPDHVPGDKQ